MFLGLCSSQSRNLFVRGLHFSKNFGAEDIIFKAVCVNIRQKKWTFLDRLSSELSNSLHSRVIREFRSSPQLLLEFYQRIGGQKSVSCSLESCCIMIHVTVGSKNYEDALNLTKQLMIFKGHTPLDISEALINSRNEGGFSNSSVFDTLVRACSEIGSTNDAYEVIKRLGVEKGYWVSIHAWNNFLSHLLKTGDVGRFWMRYREMISYGYYENVNTFNLLILALCKECKFSEAFSAFDKMLKRRIVPNVVGFNVLVDGACKVNDLDLAVELVQKIGIMSMGHVTPNIVTYNSLVNGYCKKGNPEIAEVILDKMVETVYNSLIHQLYMEGNASEASFLVSNMMENHVPPDEVTHSIIVKGLCRNGEIDEALRIHNWIAEKNSVKDAFCHNIIMSYLLRTKDIRGAKQVLCSMFIRGLVPDVDGFCKEKSVDCLVFLAEEMKRLNIYDVVTFNTLLSGYCCSGKIEEAFGLFVNMRKFGIKANKITYNIMINLFCKFGLFEHAKELLSVMVLEGFTPDEVTYTTMVTNINNMSSYEEVVKMHDYLVVHGVILNEQTYEAIIRPAIMKEIEVQGRHEHGRCTSG
ncbi:pentatricopeptide repeat-containing protein [Striga asiatica]|uniref:Pentatricopeptide repeat-containing protein n=1 Tax=Striga asiatica TaxID=4170 RepID=A0A5A7R6A1_STRAF|nr:pentatricopeptide repeat-containing protein [Striga asiatica]